MDGYNRTMLRSTKLAFIGLGKLGLTCAEIFSKSYEVYGFDPLPRKSKSIRITCSLDECINSSDIIFISVPTPHDREYDGSLPTSNMQPRDFDYSTLKKVLSEIDSLLSSGQLVVIISTVLPGTIRNQCAVLIRNAPIIYNPYLIAMGTIEYDMQKPEMLIFGTQDGNSKEYDVQRLISIYDSIISDSARIEVGAWEEAECIKIFYNTFISMKISYVNMIQDISEKLGHIDVDIVCEALSNSTMRIISNMYMKAGMGDGGPCHPRDNVALRSLSKNLNLGYDLFGAIVKSREEQARNLATTILKYGSRIVILGVSYKPNVPYLDGSYSLLLAHYLKDMGGEVYCYDPNAGFKEFPNLEGPIVFLLAHCDQWVWDFPFPKGAVVFDPWRVFQPINPHIKVIHYGNTRARNSL